MTIFNSERNIQAKNDTTGFTLSHNRNTYAKKRSYWVYVITTEIHRQKNTIQLCLRYHITEIHTQKNDPTGFTLSHNRNTYAKNNPTGFTLSHNKIGGIINCDYKSVE